jgi:2-iminoacetate synthase
MPVTAWINNRIPRKERDKYLLPGGRDFIDDRAIETALAGNRNPDASYISDILNKSRAVATVSLEETAALLHVSDPALLEEMAHTALEIKRKVYDNRIVTFAPLYLSNKCVNNCMYCGFRSANRDIERKALSLEEIREEIKVLAGKIGHKRIIAVYGEHADSDIGYIADSMRAIYDVREKTKKGYGSIRRINVNASPMSLADLSTLHQAGIGTYQVFQETYHRRTYAAVHPPGTVKSDYQWRLYCMHRALEAGIDDVGIGALFGLYDWRFEVLGLVSHAIELEAATGIGPHTISFPRLEPAENAPLAVHSLYKVSDEDFKKAIVVLRLAVPYTGMILTARENAAMRRQCIELGITQTDASTKIGLGAYCEKEDRTMQHSERQQFILGDTRSLDEVVQELAQMGYITSFCTAGYRCGRTGKSIMELLRSCREGCFCKLNAVITFREWLDDFASPETIAVGEVIIRREIDDIKLKLPEMFDAFLKYYDRTVAGERDLYF